MSWPQPAGPGKRTSSRDVAWSYPERKDAAKEITDHIAFWNRVEVAV
jgi:uncharacterized protein (DUF427 family)